MNLSFMQVIRATEYKRISEKNMSRELAPCVGWLSIQHGGGMAKPVILHAHDYYGPEPVLAELSFSNH